MPTVKYMLMISIFVFLLVLVPSRAAAVVVYNYCDIDRSEYDGLIFAIQSISPDYETAANYTIFVDLSILTTSGQYLATADQIVYPQYNWTATGIPIEAEVDLYALGTTTMIAYFYYWQYDPWYCSIYPWYAIRMVHL
jgi:hypothetical protein